MLSTINGKCLKKTCNDSLIVFKDKKGGRSKYIADNREKKIIEYYEIDGVLITEGYKCDNGLYINSDNTLFLIELKGSDLVHACEQISATIIFIKSKIKLPVLKARIVLSKVSSPDLKDAKYLKLSRDMRCYGGDLKKESIEMKEII
jgi:hypothetical protein